jgi:transposase-like protein
MVIQLIFLYLTARIVIVKIQLNNGTRCAKNSIKSIRLCRDCGRRFTNQPSTHKKKKNRFETISLAVSIAKDYSLRDTAKILKQKYGINISYVSVSTWKKEVGSKEKPIIKNNDDWKYKPLLKTNTSTDYDGNKIDADWME